MCQKQTSVSHSSTESEIISLDAGLRLDGIPALDLWDLIGFSPWNTTHNHDRTGRPVVCRDKNHAQVQSGGMFPQTSNFRIKKLCCMCLKTTKQWSRWFREHAERHGTGLLLADPGHEAAEATELPQESRAIEEDARFRNDRFNKMRPILVNHDEEDDRGDYLKFYEQIIDGAETSKYIDYMKKNRNDIYNVTGESLIPEYLKFVTSIVDPEDPALNKARETMQQNKFLRVDKKNLVKKYLEMSAETAEEKDEYKKNYEQSDGKLNDMNQNISETIFLTALTFSHFCMCLTKHIYEQQENTIVTTLAQVLKMLEKIKLNNTNQAGWVLFYAWVTHVWL